MRACAYALAVVPRLALHVAYATSSLYPAAQTLGVCLQPHPASHPASISRFDAHRHCTPRHLPRSPTGPLHAIVTVGRCRSHHHNKSVSLRRTFCRRIQAKAPSRLDTRPGFDFDYTVLARRSPRAHMRLIRDGFSFYA